MINLILRQNGKLFTLSVKSTLGLMYFELLLNMFNLILKQKGKLFTFSVKSSLGLMYFCILSIILQ